jgi:hypothetical protein
MNLFVRLVFISVIEKFGGNVRSESGFDPFNLSLPGQANKFTLNCQDLASGKRRICIAGLKNMVARTRSYFPSLAGSLRNEFAEVKLNLSKRKAADNFNEFNSIRQHAPIRFSGAIETLMKS